MKTKNIFWAALSMTAALVMTACSEDMMTETPQAPSTSKIIPYTVTVNGGATTRATVADDNKTLKFATGDKLYITGTNIKGVLEIQTGDGTTTGPGTASATFSGDLTYSGEGTPASDLALTATLVSAEQSASLTTENKLVTVSEAGAVTVNYPTTAYCADVATAVKKYSNLTGTSTYGTKSFTLAQQTAFLNFLITFEDGTATATSLTAVVKNGTTQMASASVTTTTESEKVVGKFVLPVAKGTALSSATVTMGTKAALAITDATLEGKVYNVKKTQVAAATVTTAPTATTGDITAGSTTALVTAGTASGGTLMYKVTTENTKPSSTDGFSETVPTAASLAAGTYYVWYYVKADDTHSDSEIAGPVTVTVTAAALIVNPTVGQVIGADGKNYANAAAATAAGTTAVAMIAYVGSGSNCEHGLAIQLNSSPESKKWEDGTTYPAKEYAEGLTAVPGGTWRLPSKDDWQNMFVGCAKSGDATTPDGNNEMNPIAGFKEKITAAGVTWQLGGYWSSTASSGSQAWCVGVFLDNVVAFARFQGDVTSYPYNVLGCLAF